MNFSNTSKLRKILSLILVLTMMTVLFAGCKKDEPGTPSTPNMGPNLVDPNTPVETEAPKETEAPIVKENQATVLSKMLIRSAPTIPDDPDSNKVSDIELQPGDKVEISRREIVGVDEWAYITYPTSGWIMMEYVQMDHVPQAPSATEPSAPGADAPPAENTPAGPSIKGVVSTGLNIRRGPSKGNDIVGNYNKGDVVTILETKDGWGRTDKGWVLMEYINSNNNSGTANNNTGNNTTQDKDKDKETTTVTGNGSTTVQFKGIVTATSLNVRVSPSVNADKVASLNFGARVSILEKSGNWGRTKDGWISLDHVYQDGTTGTKTAKGIITGNNLNVRSGPGTGYNSVGSMNYGDRVSILEQFTYNGVTWGCTKDGWISMQYVYVDGAGVGDDIYGTITADKLNIRSGPGTNYDSVDSLEYGDKVTILYELKLGEKTWANIDKGWISMEFVELY